MLRSAFDSAFLAQVKDWIEETEEVFVVIRYCASAGNKDYFFISSWSSFKEILQSLPPRADVIVFRRQQLPIRGTSDNNFRERVLAEVADGEEWMIIKLDEITKKEFYRWEGESHQELIEQLQELEGEQVAIGLYPPFHEADNADMQSGLIPLPDGKVQGGPY